MKNPRRFYRKLSVHELRARMAGLEQLVQLGTTCKRAAGRALRIMEEVLREQP